MRINAELTERFPPLRKVREDQGMNVMGDEARGAEDDSAAGDLPHSRDITERKRWRWSSEPIPLELPPQYQGTNIAPIEGGAAEIEDEANRSHDKAQNLHALHLQTLPAGYKDYYPANSNSRVSSTLQHRIDGSRILIAEKKRWS